MNSPFSLRFIQVHKSLRKTCVKKSVLLDGFLDLAIFTLNASKRHLGIMRVQMTFFFKFLILINVMLSKNGYSVFCVHMHTYPQINV